MTRPGQPPCTNTPRSGLLGEARVSLRLPQRLEILGAVSWRRACLLPAMTTSREVETRAEDVTVTVLRVTLGVILAVHGAMKLMDIPGTVQSFAQVGIPYPQYAVYLSLAGELLAGIGILLGALTRVAALGAFCNMAVAIGYVHLGHGLLAQNGGWEYPLLLGLVALFFVAHGAGPVSVDALATRRRDRRPPQRTERVRSYA